MFQRIRDIIASSRKALLIYAAWLTFVTLQVVSASGALVRCWVNPACTWVDFIAIIQAALEQVGQISIAMGALLPALMAVEDAATKFGLPPPATPAAPFTRDAADGTMDRTKESARVSLIKKEIAVSEPTYKLLKVIEEAVCDLLEKKPAAELSQDLANGISLLSQLPEIPKDYTVDPEAVQNAIYLAGDDLVKRVVAILKAQGDVPTPGK